MKSMAHRFNDIGEALDSLQDMLGDIFADTESEKDHPTGKVVGPLGVARALGVSSMIRQIDDLKQTCALIHGFESIVEELSVDPNAESMISYVVGTMIREHFSAEDLAEAGISDL